MCAVRRASVDISFNVFTMLHVIVFGGGSIVANVLLCTSFVFFLCACPLLSPAAVVGCTVCVGGGRFFPSGVGGLGDWWFD